MFGSFFDLQAECDVIYRRKPHWTQVSAIVFITFRLADSLPQVVLRDWERAREDWLARHGCRRGSAISDSVAELPEKLRREFYRKFNGLREEYLDNGFGSCLLQDRANQLIVAEALKCFDGSRYELGDFVIMPNHVHLLASFPGSTDLLKQYDSWLHYSARQINLRNGVKGKVWQGEPFDHLVRSPEQLKYLRDYIADNPAKARLTPEQFYYWRRPD